MLFQALDCAELELCILEGYLQERFFELKSYGNYLSMQYAITHAFPLMSAPH